MADNSDSAGARDSALPCFAVKIQEAAVITGTTRSRIYGAIRNKELTARKAGKSTVVLVDELGAWLKSLPAIGKAPETGVAALKHP
jgi:excisionase family DNA binding protein